MKLIVGLGNPGQGFTHNRHNIGFMCLNHFAGTHGIKFDKKQGLARTGRGTVAGDDVILARPQTYMNESGLSVNRLLAKFDILLNNLLVIHDDLDLPPGKIRLRQGGGSGGHKGIESIFNEIDSQEFLRLRVGIGRPVLAEATAANDTDIITHVLGDFTDTESQIIARVIPQVTDAILCLLTKGLTAAMNKYN